MPKIDWFTILGKVKPFLFKIETPNGSGTGFQIYLTEGSDLCAVATADHVISHEDNWGESIKLIHNESGRSVLLKDKERVIFRFSNDTSVIVFNKKELPIKSVPLQLIEEGSLLKQGVEVGWYGFPSVSINSLCFFAGYISCLPGEGKDNYYLVDGVVINGVSGGPVFYITNEGDAKFAGVISAYIPNRRATGETLPGLGVVRIIDECQKVIKNLKSLEEAKKKEEEEAKKKEEEEAKKKEEEAKKKEEEAKKKEEEEAKKKEEEEAKKKQVKAKKIKTGKTQKTKAKKSNIK